MHFKSFVSSVKIVFQKEQNNLYPVHPKCQHLPWNKEDIIISYSFSSFQFPAYVGSAKETLFIDEVII